ncbi:MAG TPA: hypothetical protein PKD00_02515 [Burkholderiales bacterium]|nr:hypothetical protein [Burkholderiales bacterium]
MACKDCGTDEKCYDDIVYGHCVKVPNKLSYLGLNEYHNLVEFENAITNKVQTLNNYQVNASAIQITVNSPCIDTSSNCVPNTNFTYTLTETATGLNFEQNFEDVLLSNDITTWVGQIKVINTTGVLDIINISGTYTPFITSFNNLDLPVTVITDLYVTVSGQLIYLNSVINIDNCVDGSFATFFSCAPSNTIFSGSLLTYMELMGKKICFLTKLVEQLQTLIQ